MKMSEANLMLKVPAQAGPLTMRHLLQQGAAKEGFRICEIEIGRHMDDFVNDELTAMIRGEELALKDSFLYQYGLN